MTMATDAVKQLEDELGRAYRAIQGFAHARAEGKVMDDALYGYHSLAIAAAKRFVFEQSLEGSAYFEGKPVEVLHKALKR